MITRHIMVDLETLGVVPGSVVLAIGATDSLGRDFYVNIDRADSEEKGLLVNPATEVWWGRQCPEARAALTNPTPVCLREALSRFSDYIGGTGMLTLLWGNSAAFDLGLLASAHAAAFPDAEPMWSHRQEMCYRTLKRLKQGVPAPSFIGTPHNALHDAKHQLAHLKMLLKHEGNA